VLGETGCLNFARSFIAYLTADGLRLEEIEPDMVAFETEILQTVRQIRAETEWKPAAGEICADCGFAVLCHGAARREPEDNQQA